MDTTDTTVCLGTRAEALSLDWTGHMRSVGSGVGGEEGREAVGPAGVARPDRPGPFSPENRSRAQLNQPGKKTAAPRGGGPGDHLFIPSRPSIPHTRVTQHSQQQQLSLCHAHTPAGRPAPLPIIDRARSSLVGRRIVHPTPALRRHRWPPPLLPGTGTRCLELVRRRRPYCCFS
jgi:hypothetical protein